MLAGGAAVLTRHLDPDSDRAVFRQIADHLRELIGQGTIPPGDWLPSESRLMGHYGVTRMTVRHVVSRSRRCLLDGRPVEVAISYVPADIARGTAITQPNPGPGGIYARLEALGFRLDHFDEEIRARMSAARRTTRSL